MKTVSSKCPECCGTMTIDDDRSDAYCAFCGHHVLLDKEETEAERIRRLKLEAEKRKRKEEKISQEKDDKNGIFIPALTILTGIAIPFIMTQC